MRTHAQACVCWSKYTTKVSTVLRMLVEVQWVELGGPILRLATWFDKDSNYLLILALDKIILEETRRVLRNDNLYEVRLGKLKKMLPSLNHNKNIINTAFERAMQVSFSLSLFDTNLNSNCACLGLLQIAVLFLGGC